VRLLNAGGLQALQDHLGEGLFGPIFGAVLLEAVNQIVVLVHAEHTVRAKAFNGERTSDPNLLLVVIRLVIQVFGLGLGRDANIHFLLLVDARLPPFGVQLLGLVRPIGLGVARHFPFVPLFFERVRVGLQSHNRITLAQMFTSLAAAIATKGLILFDFTVVDEAQDLSPAHLKLLAALGGGRPNALFFAGDLGQRIFQQPFSWKALGVDIRGRSRTLRVNYRTSHQIRTQADRLLGTTVTDVDGNTDDRSDTVSIFNGPPPTIQAFRGQDEEIKAVADWIAGHARTGVAPHEFGLFVRSADQLSRAESAAKEAGLAFKVLDENVETISGFLSISTMHLAKGLEFRAVAVVACDDEIIPLQERIEMVGDDADLQEVYDTERHLLYVACTRARDYLLVTGVDPVSEFLEDLTKSDHARSRAAL